MTGDLDPRRTAVERRLERLAAGPPTPALRRRVLTAVDDVLARPRTPSRDDGPTNLRGWAWAAAAVGLALAAPGVVGVASLRLSAPVTLVDRVRLCGLADDDLLALAATPPHALGPRSPGRPDATRGRRHPLAFVETRRLLEENP